KGQLERVELRVGITHPRRGDLSVALVSPAGTRVQLHKPSSDTTANLRGCYGDGVPGDLVAAEDLAFLQGESEHGTWQVVVTDTRAGERGTLDVVALTIFERPVVAPAADEVLPNLRMSPPGNVSIEHDGNKKLLEFDTTVANLGPGPFMIRGKSNAQDHVQEAYQQIYKKKLDAHGKLTGFTLVREQKIGEFAFDSDSGHFDFKDWAS